MTIGVLVDVDLGMKRTGVATAEAAVELARQVSATPGLRFDGLMGYEGHTLMIADPAEKRAAIAAAIGKLLQARDLVEAAGLQCRIISAGRLGLVPVHRRHPRDHRDPGRRRHLRLPVLHPGLPRHGPPARALAFWPPSSAGLYPDRAILDIGQKSVSQHQTPPVLRDYPDCRVIGLSAEHATIAVEPRNRSANRRKSARRFPVIAILLSCSTIACSAIVRAGGVEAVWDLLGRGRCNKRLCRRPLSLGYQPLGSCVQIRIARI